MKRRDHAVNAPVVIFAYNRMDKLRACMASLKSSAGHERSEVIVFSDGAKGDDDREDVGRVRDYLDSLSGRHVFKSLTVIKRSENMGLADNIISGVTEVIERYGRVIVLEDDLIVTEDFLSFMNDALDFYEDESDIWSVTGFGIPIRGIEGYDHDIYYSYRASSYGWGTWKDRWQTVDWDMKGYEDIIADKRLRRRFERGGKDLTRILKDQKMGLIDSWAIRWCLTQSLQGRYTVYPVRSFVVNTGRDGSGTHEIRTDNDFGNLHTAGERVRLESLSPDKRICREFYGYYSSVRKRLSRNMNLTGIRRQIRRLLLQL